jgi:SAM-dependent methyltransferase
MSPIDDPATVKAQYATEANLQARQALWIDAEGIDPKEVLWRTLEEWQPSRLLEVGGGQGELAERIRRELGADVSFVDLSPRMVELAQARGIDAQVGDVRALPFAAGTFDTVVAAWMLYHVREIDQALAEIARVLEPGGALIAVTNGFDHIIELRDLVAYEGNFNGTFSRENGDELLRPHFASIERFDADVTVQITERQKLVAYRDSVSAPTREVPEDVELPFVVHGRTSIFFATT